MIQNSVKAPKSPYALARHPKVTIADVGTGHWPSMLHPLADGEAQKLMMQINFCGDWAGKVPGRIGRVGSFAGRGCPCFLLQGRKSVRATGNHIENHVQNRGLRVGYQKKRQGLSGKQSTFGR